MTVIAQDDHLTAGAWAACDSGNALPLAMMKIYEMELMKLC